jgi:hypothetical protein
MKLGLQLGRHDIDNLASEIDSQQLSEWMAYDRLDPIGPDGTYLMLAQVAYQIYMQSTHFTGSRKLTDFMPNFCPEPVKKRTLTDKAYIIASMFGCPVKNPRDQTS